MSDPCMVLYPATHQNDYLEAPLTGSVAVQRPKQFEGHTNSNSNSNYKTPSDTVVHNPRGFQTSKREEAVVTDTSDMSEQGDRTQTAVAAPKQQTRQAEVVPKAEEGSSSMQQIAEAKQPQHAAVARADNEQVFRVRVQQNRGILLRQLSLTLVSGRLTLINLSRRGLLQSDAELVKQAIMSNPTLTVLKLSYNELGDAGAALIGSGVVCNGVHHQNLTTLDMGFNRIGDSGCTALALHAVAGNSTLHTLYLSGNCIEQKGVMALSGAILHGCNLTALHLSANKVGTAGIQVLARAIAERELQCQNKEDDNQDAQTMEELYLDGTSMDSSGFVTIPSMLLTNASMRRLCLANNGLDDNDVALLAQSLSRNKNVPLECLQLSFNEITCVGVECIMNAVWGSTTLRELRFDNNNIRDRGAQLAAVVLTSINLAVIDLSFNRVTAVGIKALMKSLSENSTMHQLGLSGIPLDLNSAKALSYGLAYNSSLTHLHMDSSSIGYSAQRHVVAGIVSNKFASIKVLTGFRIGAISVTLGLPQTLERWSNDQVLSFVRLMWKKWREDQGIGSDASNSEDANGSVQLGPAAPAVVVAAAKNALSMIGQVGASSLKTEPYQLRPEEGSPLVHATAAILEKTLSGTIRVPPVVEGVDESTESRIIDAWTEAINRTSEDSSTPEFVLDPNQKQRNLQWLRSHFRELHEIARLPFNHADLWQLHQYFFSPLVEVDSLEYQSYADKEASRESLVQESLVQESLAQDSVAIQSALSAKTPHSSPHPSGGDQSSVEFGRSISFQMLGDAVAASVPVQSRRRSLAAMEGDENGDDNVDDDDDDEDEDDFSSSSDEVEPASKRPKNFKPRIAYYPRIRSELESLGQKASQAQVLSLLRQLKFVESVMFDGRDVYLDNQHVREVNQPMPTDVEMVLLDLL